MTAWIFKMKLLPLLAHSFPATPLQVGEESKEWTLSFFIQDGLGECMKLVGILYHSGPRKHWWPLVWSILFKILNPRFPPDLGWVDWSPGTHSLISIPHILVCYWIPLFAALPTSFSTPRTLPSGRPGHSVTQFTPLALLQPHANW